MNHAIPLTHHQFHHGRRESLSWMIYKIFLAHLDINDANEKTISEANRSALCKTGMILSCRICNILIANGGGKWKEIRW